MKIKYEFITGENTEVEVNESIGSVILESRRNESNSNRKHRRHCLSYDTDETWDGDWFASSDTAESITLNNIENECIKNALDSLSEIQRKRLLMLADGMSINEIARVENINPNAAWKSIENARKNFKKFFSKMGV